VQSFKMEVILGKRKKR